MTKDEAMKLALTALLSTYPTSADQYARERDAITALREALAQPQQEPVADVRAYAYSGVAKNGEFFEAVLREGARVSDGDKLYTSPPAQPQHDSLPNGLTEDETSATASVAGLLRKPAQPQQEPVAWVRWEWNRSGLKSLVFKKPEELSLAETATGVVYDPLYTSPPAQEIVCSTGLCHYRKPLEGKHIRALWEQESKPERSTAHFFTAFARAIEAAHGIKGDA